MKFIWKLFLSMTFLVMSLIFYQEISRDYKTESSDIFELKEGSEDLETLFTNFYQIEKMFDSLITSFNKHRQSIHNYKS